MTKLMTYYGVAPAFMFRPSKYVLPGTIYSSKIDAQERAKQENQYGEYRGKGCRVVRCDKNGRIKPK